MEDGADRSARCAWPERTLAKGFDDPSPCGGDFAVCCVEERSRLDAASRMRGYSIRSQVWGELQAGGSRVDRLDAWMGVVTRRVGKMMMTQARARGSVAATEQAVK